MVREGPAQQPPQQPRPYPADKARGAEIELRRTWQRYVFIGGLVGIIVLLAVLRILAVV
jgi:hypothetical protein